MTYLWSELFPRGSDVDRGDERYQQGSGRSSARPRWPFQLLRFEALCYAAPQHEVRYERTSKRFTATD
jgi:hypothetical protein